MSSALSNFNLSRGTAFPTRSHVRLAKAQIKLHIRAVWEESSQDTLWVANDPKCLQGDSKDSDQPACYVHMQSCRKCCAQAHFIPLCLTLSAPNFQTTFVVYFFLLFFFFFFFFFTNYHLKRSLYVKLKD